MEKYLIEVPHEATKSACVYAVRIFLETGSHFLRQGLTARRPHACKTKRQGQPVKTKLEAGGTMHDARG